MIHLYAVNIFSDSEQYFRALYEILSEERKTKLRAFKFQEDKIRCLLAEILLKYGLWEQYKLPREILRFGFGEFKKPYLIGYEQIHFNLSHSGNWVFCGIGEVSLGVDVERMKEDHLDIAKSFYTEEEYKDILNKPVELQKRAFYELWTLKESYMKAVGAGLSIGLNTFGFQKKDSKIRLVQKEKDGSSYVFFSSQLDQEHITAVCAKSDTDSVIDQKIKILTIGELAASLITGKLTDI